MGNIAMQSSSAGWIEEWTEENLGELVMFSQSFREINQQVGGGEIDKGDYGEVS